MKFFILLALVCISLAAPFEDNSEDSEANKAPDGFKAYSYKYSVKDEAKELFFEKSEEGDDQGKVSGKFSVLLADGRLMHVEYSADKEDGFVPKISYTKNADPFSGA